MQVAPMEAVPARVQTGKTFGEVFFREAEAYVRTQSYYAVYLLFPMSGGYINVVQHLKKLHKIPEIRLFFHFFGFKT
jgi:hypothetical protein